MLTLTFDSDVQRVALRIEAEIEPVNLLAETTAVANHRFGLLDEDDRCSADESRTCSETGMGDDMLILNRLC